MELEELQEVKDLNPEIPAGYITGCGMGPSRIFNDALFRQKRKKGKFREVELPFDEPYSVIADTHAHLDIISSAPLSLARCAVHNVGFICSIVDAVEDPDTTFEQVENWQVIAKDILTSWGEADKQIPGIRIAIGCHPHNAKDYTDEVERYLLKRLADPRVCAIGEVGLDYFYDKSPRESQREVFRRQIRLAHKTGLPLILHMREAHGEGFQILEEEGFPEAGVLLHCFNLDKDVLRPWADKGCFIAYGGPLTFKNCDYVREAALLVQKDRLLTETDSPFMTPEPMRGFECGPEHTIYTAAFMTELFGCETVEQKNEFLAQLYSNAQGLLNRVPSSWQLSNK